jgi:CheY-like chemotaxis protein
MLGTKILIIEDDSFKLERISNCLDRLTPRPTTTVVMAVQTAVAALTNHTFDIVLLDMALPSHQTRPGGGPPSSLLSGGMEIIMELSFLKRPERVIVITQYPEIEIEGTLVAVDHVEETIRRIYNVNLGAVIHYKHEETEWENTLIREVG